MAAVEEWWWAMVKDRNKMSLSKWQEEDGGRLYGKGVRDTWAHVSVSISDGSRREDK